MAVGGIDPSLDLDFDCGDIPWQIDRRKVVFAAGAVDQLLAEGVAQEGRRRVDELSWEAAASRYLEVFAKL